MRIEMDVFSGQAAPAWSLSGPQLSELQTRLAGLRPAPEAPAPDALGYRGLRLTPSPSTGQALGKVTLIEVGAGIVRLHDEHGALTTLSDVGMALERWLVDSAKGHIDEALRLWVLKALPPKP